MMGFVRRFFVPIALVAMAACSSATPSPTSPSGNGNPTASVTLSGTYAGSVSDSSGAGTMTWTVSQSAGSVTGPVTAKTALGIVVFTGSLAGTLTGASLTFKITVPAGGVSGFPDCNATIDGTAPAVSNSTISGTYTGTSSCAGAFTDGRFNLAKQ